MCIRDRIWFESKEERLLEFCEQHEMVITLTRVEKFLREDVIRGRCTRIEEMIFNRWCFNKAII